MADIYKVILSVLTILIVGLGVFYAFRFFNKKIKESESWVEIILNTFLFFLVCALMFFGVLFLLGVVYSYLAG